jgi:hypothetical protein
MQIYMILCRRCRIFANFRKATISFVMFVFLFVNPHVTTRLPIDRFFEKEDLNIFRKSVEKIRG